ncbi:HEAT repeat protein [Ancylostoma duodenale]|uniref:HEAT repeat protein n=1 Tax=Ancylostoma duodenale TaxID=51022 RepID=A0A0C2GM66_9BILA|nr:HEAT repeat protein [Ancylostoma duodenale]
MLQAAFNKVEEQSTADKPRFKTIFFEKIQYRLCFMVEALTSFDSRIRVLRFLARFSLNQWRKGITDFINFAVKFCEELSCCEDAVVRQNICTFTGFLLGEGRGQDVIGTARVLSVPLRQSLYSILLDRQLDKSGAVRREVILSLAVIQDDEIPNDFPEALERSPKDVILMGLRDSVADCRLTAAYAINVVVPEHADFLIEIASSDPVPNVRAAAIRQLAKLPLTFFTEQQRMDLLRGVIFEDELRFHKLLFKMLFITYSYPNGCHSSIDNKKEGTGVEHKEEIDESAIMNLSQNLRDLKTDHGYGSAAQGLLTVLDFCDDPEAEQLARSSLFVVFDVIREKLQMEHSHLTHFVSSFVNDNTFPEVLSTHNYGTLLDRSLSGTDQAQYAFFWRTLIEYCSNRAEDEVDLRECVHMLAPPLTEMCGLVQKWTSYEPSTDIYCCDEGAAQICDIHQVAILHLLGILRHLDHTDHMGMTEWRCLLLLLLRDRVWSKEITDCAMVDLAEFFFDEKPEQFLATLYDVIAEAIVADSNHSFAKENNGPATSPPKKPRRSLDLRQISACLTSRGSQMRIWALEAAGILGTLDLDIARSVLSGAMEALRSDEEPLKMSVIDVVTDLIAVYGCTDVFIWCHDGAGDSDSGPVFINELIDIVMSKTTGPPLCLKTCECLAKIVLLESFSSDEHYLVEALVALISRMFHSLTSKLPNVKNCLERFFAMYAAVSRKNQLLIVAAFHELMSQIRTASEDDFILRIDIAAALNLIVGSTTKALLKNAPDKKMSVIDVVTDLIAVYGCTDVFIWCHDGAGDSEAGPVFINELIDIVMSKCIFYYFGKNQLLIVAAFHELMSQIRTASEDDFILRIDIAAALNLIVGSTTKALLKNAPDKKDGSVQPNFMREVLQYAVEHRNDTCALLYWETAAALDLDEFPLDDLKQTQQTVADNFEVVTAIATAKNKITSEIQRLMRNVEHAMSTYSARAAAKSKCDSLFQEAEGDDRLTELREKFAHTPGRGRRLFYKREKIHATTLGWPNNTISTEICMMGFSIPAVTNSLITPVQNRTVTPVTRTRPVLARSAKAAATNTTRRWLFGNNDEDDSS